MGESNHPQPKKDPSNNTWANSRQTSIPFRQLVFTSGDSFLHSMESLGNDHYFTITSKLMQ